MRDDIIAEINKMQINNTKDYDTLVSEIKSDENILILIFRKNSALYITLPVK